MAAPVSVFQYNILSSALAPPDHFPKNRPEDLDGPTRLDRVIKLKLTKAVADQSIIALQEVCLSWSGPLEVFFAKNGYQFHCSLYGAKHSDFMGVALAWPTKLYECLDLEACCLADTKSTPWVKAPQPAAPAVSCFSGVLDKLGLRSAAPAKAPPFDPWTEAARRQNRMVLARLRPYGGHAFVVSTYHMPCLFGSAQKVQVMNIHVALAVQRLNSMANGQPCMLLTDANIKPGDSPYKLVTTATLPESDPEFPVPFSGDSWTVNPLPMRMRSAYRVCLGSEPEFTNYAITAWDGKLSEPFIETLDYIFISDHWKVLSCSELPKLAGFQGPCPTQDEPSDHIALGAVLVPTTVFTKLTSTPTVKRK